LATILFADAQLTRPPCSTSWPPTPMAPPQTSRVGFPPDRAGSGGTLGFRTPKTWYRVMAVVPAVEGMVAASTEDGEEGIGMVDKVLTAV
jgi:hypothetical protein